MRIGIEVGVDVGVFGIIVEIIVGVNVGAEFEQLARKTNRSVMEIDLWSMDTSS
jgi:hypothetical protein